MLTQIMEVKKPKHLKKRSFIYLYRIGCRVLLSLITLQSILTKLAVEDIKKVSKAFIGEKQDVFINPKGPLNLLRGYIGNRNGYMYNKRFYSSEIDTDYALSKKEISSKNEQVYKFTRTPVNDRVYKDIATQAPNSKYLSTYHAQLIKMFPSAAGNLSIEAGRPNALTNFLRAEHVKKDAKYILAALLLLSEGIDIKIAVDHTEKKKKLVIKSKTVQKKVFVKVEMHTASIDPAAKTYKEDIYQHETAQIINFYIRCKENPLLKKGGEFAMPTTREEFQSGRFLNSAGFLIQTYIYEFINTAEDYKDFVDAVHELLVDQFTEKSNLNRYTKKNCRKVRIFKELFLVKGASDENIKHIESFCNLIQATNIEIRFPFLDSSQLPRYTKVPQCKLDKSGFERSKALYYSDCVETALLGLFCCLAYNPRTKKYETRHMGAGISKELKEFFEKYPKPTKAADFEMHKEWSRVVACLKNDKIDYEQDKNGLLSGIGNIFLAIAEITDQKKHTLALIKYIENVCRAGKLDNKQISYISDKIELIIRALSLNTNVRVNCSHMELEKRSNGKADIFSEIKFIYTFNKARSEIVLKIDTDHTDLTFLSLQEAKSAYIIEEYKKVKSIYDGLDCYIGYIMDHYFYLGLADSGSDSKIHLEYRKYTTDHMLQNSFKEPYKVLLLGKLTSTSIKSWIIKTVILSTIGTKIDSTNYLVRFTRNILGSVPLNDFTVQQIMMRFFPFHASWQKYYPRLGYKPSEHPADAIWETTEIMHLHSVLLNLPASIAYKAMQNYLRASINNEKVYDLRLWFIASEELFEHITSYKLVSNLMEIHCILTKSTKAVDLNYICFLWFIHTCSSGSGFSTEFIKKVYSFVTLDDDLASSVMNALGNTVLTSRQFKKCLSVLEERKALFCTEDDRKSMEKYDKLVLYFRKPTFPPV
ncbi:hypothetical protein NEAUS07_1020 [Nematocida ausubeli]|nr:hypothetical protein NEAUS07_1020 [Nematocida ausubeli]